MRYCCILPPFGCRESRETKGNRFFESEVLWLKRQRSLLFCNVCCYEKRKKERCAELVNLIWIRLFFFFFFSWFPASLFFYAREENFVKYYCILPSYGFRENLRKRTDKFFESDVLWCSFLPSSKTMWSLFFPCLSIPQCWCTSVVVSVLMKKKIICNLTVFFFWCSDFILFFQEKFVQNTKKFLLDEVLLHFSSIWFQRSDYDYYCYYYYYFEHQVLYCLVSFKSYVKLALSA